MPDRLSDVDRENLQGFVDGTKEPHACYVRTMASDLLAIDERATELASALRLAQWGADAACGACLHLREEGHAAGCVIGLALHP